MNTERLIYGPASPVVTLVSGLQVLMDLEDALRFVGVPLFVASNGYVKVGAKGWPDPFLHRLIGGASEDQVVDHINGSPLDNRKENLRVCTQAENNRNKRLRSNNQTGITGVYWDARRLVWAAQISVSNRTVPLGRHASLLDACAARRSAEIRSHGEYAATLGVLAQ